MSLLYVSEPMIFDFRMYLAKMPCGLSSSNLETTSTFGVFCTRLRAIRRTMPAVSPLDTLGRSSLGEITSLSASISSFSKPVQRTSISRLNRV